MSLIDKQIGSYRLVKEIGRGGYGVVFQASHTFVSEQTAAVKFLRADRSDTDKEREEFLQEARFLYKLKHQYILRILDVNFTEEGDPYIISEYAPGGSLRNLLKRQAGRPLPFHKTLRLLTQVGEALEYAHQQNIIHRDLKPENILFSEQGDALLSDFGLAAALDSASVKLTATQGKGTLAYMSPEQFKGTTSREGDQYALGCLAYELYTGRRVFDATEFPAVAFQHATQAPTPPTHYNPQLPDYIEQAILRALAKERTDRYPSISAFIHALSSTSEEEHSVPPTMSSSNWLSEGEAHLRLNRPKEALAVFEQVLQFTPANVAALLGKSKSLAVLERYEEALQVLQEVIRLEPGAPSHIKAREVIRAQIQRKKEEQLSSQQLEIQDTKRALEQYTRGNALYKQKRYEEALQAFAEAVRLEQGNANYQSGRGRTLYNLKRYEEALVVFQTTARLEPKISYHAKMQGEIFHKLQRYEEALGAFQTAARLEPKAAYYLKMQWEILCKLKRYEEALEVVEEAIRLEPKDAFLTKRQEICNQIKQREQEQLRPQSQAPAPIKEQIQAQPRQQKKEPQPVSQAPNAALEQYNQGQTLYKMKQYEEALLAFDKAVSMKPGNATYQSARARTLYDLKRYHKALAAFEVAARLEPNIPDHLKGQGDTLYKLKRYQEALQVFEKAAQLEPKSAYYHKMQGEALYELKRFLIALQAFEKAARLEPDNRSHLKRQEQIRAQLKQNEKAPSPSKPPTHQTSKSTHIADMPTMFIPLSVSPVHQMPKSTHIADMQTSLLPPSQSPAHQPSGNPTDEYKRGLALYRKKSYQQALVALDKAVELEPRNSHYQCVRGRILYALKRYQEALVTFDQAIQLNSKDHEAYFRKAEVLKALGRDKEAEKILIQTGQMSNGDKKQVGQNNGSKKVANQNNASQSQENRLQSFLKRLLG